MHALGGTRERLTAAATVLLAAACGAFLAQANPRALLLVGALTLAAFAVVSFEAPIVALAAVVVLLGAVSEELDDDHLLGGSETVYGRLISYVNLPLLLLGLLALVLALTFDSSSPVWPGAPATAAVGLLLVAVTTLALRDELGKALLVVRPLVLLVLAILVGYWIALRYGSRLPFRALVLAAVLAIPIGLYNASTGDLSYYDSSVVYLLGLSFVLVLFRAVDIGFARAPFLILSALVIVLSLRRGAMLGIAITFLITGLLAGRGTFRAVIAIAAGTVIAAELLAPGIIMTHVENVVTYFTGASGQDYAVNYRHYETANAWLNVKDNWLFGIGAINDWTLYRTFDGAFTPVNREYLHNSYLWVWLRYGLVGLVAFVAFLGIAAATLIRRSAPVAVVAVGASMVGLAATLVTASFLTTTTRWPLTVGLFLGIALGASREASAATTDSREQLDPEMHSDDALLPWAGPAA